MKARHAAIIDLTGQRFGRLVVIEFVGIRQHLAAWRCKCDCGVFVVRQSTILRKGKSRSCGCLHRELSAAKCLQQSMTHGDARRGKATKEYRTWQKMIRRCTIEKSHNYQYYGGRGIKVCAEWRGDYRAFLADVGRAPSPKHSIDRYPDNDGDYAPGNVRWATAKEQRANQRPA